MYIKTTKLAHPAVILLVLIIAIAAVFFTKAKQKMSNSIFGKAASTANSVGKLKDNIPNEHELKDLLDEKTEDIKKELIINREYYIIPQNNRRIYRYDPYYRYYDPYRYYYISPNSPYYQIPPNTPHYYYNPPLQIPKPNPQPCPPHNHEHKKFF